MNLSKLPVIKLPVVDVTTDPLDLLLASLGLRMKQLARTSPKFIEMIYDRQFRIEIAAENGAARHLVVDHGQVRTETAAGQLADFSIVFANTDYAVKTLLKGDSSAFMSGMQNGEIKMEGDFSLLVWFTKAAKLIPPKLPKPVMQKYQQLRHMIRQKTGH
jgi:hypothetical protein